MLPLGRAYIAAVIVVAAPAPLGCKGPATIPHPAYAPQPSSALTPIAHEPPPARVETIPPRPATPDTVWIDGEWSWRKKRWAWTPGRWVAPPKGATYSPWVTVRGPDGQLYFAAAQWHDAKGAELAAPKPIVSAAVESGAVVDAEGEMERTTLAGAEE